MHSSSQFCLGHVSSYRATTLVSECILWPYFMESTGQFCLTVHPLAMFHAVMRSVLSYIASLATLQVLEWSVLSYSALFVHIACFKVFNFVLQCIRWPCFISRVYLPDFLTHFPRMSSMSPLTADNLPNAFSMALYLIHSTLAFLLSFLSTSLCSFI